MNRKNKHPHVCEQCLCTFLGRRLSQFCSRLCQHESERIKAKRQKCLCLICGAEFFKQLGAIRHRGTGGRYCSADCRIKATTTHGKTKSPEYKAWRGIRERCTNPALRSYSDYGGRGISICPEWADSFAEFYRHVGDRPSPHHTIERINNEGNYEPGNVKWATMHDQARNKRNTKLLTLNGMTKCQADWARMFGVDPTVIQSRLSRGWPVADAITIPPQPRTCSPRRKKRYGTNLSPIT